MNGTLTTPAPLVSGDLIFQVKTSGTNANLTQSPSIALSVLADGTPSGNTVKQLMSLMDDKLVIRSSGNVGIGTSSPVSMLHIKKDASTLSGMIEGGIKLENPGITLPATQGNANIFLGYYGGDFLRFDINSNQIFVLSQAGNASLAGTLTENSDIDLKDEIKPLERSLDKLTRLQGVYYKWKDIENRGDKQQLGLIAQDVEKVFPEAVSEDNTGTKGIAYSRLVAPLIEAVKELKIENDALKKKYADLLIRVEALEKKTR
jgi:hypothetical protein